MVNKSSVGRRVPPPSSTLACSGHTTSSRRSALGWHSGDSPLWKTSACSFKTEDQEAWLATSPRHVREVYKQGFPSYVFQFILKLLDFPEWEGLVYDLFWGFPLLGQVPPGSGWLLRSDAKYNNPWTSEQFEASNTSNPRSDEHSETMLEEAQKEATKARFVGPYSLQWLQAQSELHKVYAARAFAIVQDDKIRRGDDWLRSAHNIAQCGQRTSPPSRGQQQSHRAFELWQSSACQGSLQWTTKGLTELSPFVDQKSVQQSSPVRRARLPAPSPTFWFGGFGLELRKVRRRSLLHLGGYLVRWSSSLCGRLLHVRGRTISGPRLPVFPGTAQSVRHEDEGGQGKTPFLTPDPLGSGLGDHAI